MSWWPSRLRRRRDRDLDEEIGAHLALATRDRIERGASPPAARLAAQPIDQARAEMALLDRWRAEELAKNRNAPFLRQFQIEVEPAGSGFAALRDRFATPLAVAAASAEQPLTLPVETVLPIAVATMAMIAVALLAAYIPARRASRVQPKDALRHT